MDRKELVTKLRQSKEFRDAFLCETVKHSIATQIRQLRESRGWSQKELAEKLHTTHSAVARMESINRRGFTSIRMLLKIASVFDVALIIKFVDYVRFLEEMVFITPEGVYIPSSEESLKAIADG